jgi:hypothetical protein
VIWSSNGDINAGEGAKTTSVVPPPNYRTDPDAYFIVNPASEVTGAGIATLQTVPGSPPGNVYLLAPRGTVDAGAAGIRVSGNLSIAALYVANAFNIQVQGVSTGLPTVSGPPVGALTVANNTAGAAKPAMPVAPNTGSQVSVIIVEVLGYGGGGGGDQPPARDDNDTKRRNDRDQSQRQDSNSAVQILGAGTLDDQAMHYLTADEKAKLSEH